MPSGLFLILVKCASLLHGLCQQLLLGWSCMLRWLRKKDKLKEAVLIPSLFDTSAWSSGCRKWFIGRTGSSRDHIFYLVISYLLCRRLLRQCYTKGKLALTTYDIWNDITFLVLLLPSRISNRSLKSFLGWFSFTFRASDLFWNTLVLKWLNSVWIVCVLLPGLTLSLWDVSSDHLIYSGNHKLWT